MAVVAVTVAVTVQVVGDLAVGVDQRGDRATGPLEVALVLHDHVERRGQHVGGELLDPEHGQGAGPVDGLGDARRLAQLQLAQAAHDVDEALGQRLGEAGVLGADDLQLAAGVGVVEEQVQAAPLQRRGQVAGVVGGEDDVGQVLRRDRADLGDGDLELREQLEQDRLQRLVGAVDLVDQQHDGLGGADRLQQWSRREEALGEEHAVLGRDPLDGLGEVGGVLDDLPDLLAQDLGVEHLLAVVPLVERRGLVLTLVALQAQQPAAGDGGQRGGQLGLADTGGALEQDRLVQAGLQEHGRGQALVGEVARLGEPGAGVVDAGEGVARLVAHVGCSREVVGRGWGDRVGPGVGRARGPDGLDRRGTSRARPTGSTDGSGYWRRSSRSPFMQWSTTGRTVSKVHSLALPGVHASPRTWFVIRSTSASSPVICFAFS